MCIVCCRGDERRASGPKSCDGLVLDVLIDDESADHAVELFVRVLFRIPQRKFNKGQKGGV